MTNNKLYIWAPTKGWKCIGSYTDFDTALDLARELEPLEVKITDRKGRSYYGGRYHETRYDMAVFNNLPKKGEHE